MKKDQLQKLRNKRLLLWPVPWEVDEAGERVSFRDDLWCVYRTPDPLAPVLTLVNHRNMATLPLGLDHLHAYQTTTRGDGRLLLRGLVHLRGTETWIAPGPYPNSGVLPAAEGSSQ